MNLRRNMSLQLVKQVTTALPYKKKSTSRKKSIIRSNKRFKVVSVRQTNQDPQEFIQNYRYRRQKEEIIKQFQAYNSGNRRKDQRSQLRREVLQKKEKLESCLYAIQEKTNQRTKQEKGQDRYLKMKAGKGTIKVFNPFRVKQMDNVFETQFSRISGLKESFISNSKSPIDLQY